MKICFVSPSVGTIAGGSETIIHQFAKYLGEEHEVTILTGRSRYKPMQKGIMEGPYEVVTVPFWPRFTPLNNFASKISRRLTPYKTESFSFHYNVLLRPKIKQKIENMDVISTHYWLDSRLFSNLAIKLGVPSVFHILGGPYSREFFSDDKSTLYVATSRYTQKLLNETHNFYIEDVVTPGIPSDLFLRQKKKKSEVEKRLLFVGRLQKSKGLFELIEVYTKLLKLNQNLRLIIVGDGEIMGQLKNLVLKRNLQNKLTFTGQLSYEDVFEYYLGSTLFIFPSKNETFGIVPLEAMACGLPVVASDIPALRESTGENAVLIPPEDVDLWVETIYKLLEDEKQRNKWSSEGIEWARKYTWEKKSEEYEKTLLKAIKIFRCG